MACPTRPAAVVERRTWKTPLVIFASRLILYILFCRFQIGYDGRLAVTVGPRQAIAVHTGARTRYEVETSSPRSVHQVSVLFSVTATTAYGEVSAVLGFCGSLDCAWLTSRDRIFLSWAACRNSVAGNCPTRYVCESHRRTMGLPTTKLHTDPFGSDELPRLGGDGVLTPRQKVPVQVPSQTT
jgi:hypothetical protein